MSHIGHTFRWLRGKTARYPVPGSGASGATTPPGVKGKAMDSSDDISRMNDPDFLAEYSRTRETLEGLTDRMRTLTDEFDRRARATWSSSQREAS
jgi:hypothetical protein